MDVWLRCVIDREREGLLIGDVLLIQPQGEGALEAQQGRAWMRGSGVLLIGEERGY